MNHAAGLVIAHQQGDGVVTDKIVDLPFLEFLVCPGFLLVTWTRQVNDPADDPWYENMKSADYVEKNGSFVFKLKAVD